MKPLSVQLVVGALRKAGLSINSVYLSVRKSRSEVDVFSLNRPNESRRKEVRDALAPLPYVVKESEGRTCWIFTVTPEGKP